MHRRLRPNACDVTQSVLSPPPLPSPASIAETFPVKPFTRSPPVMINRERLSFSEEKRTRQNLLTLIKLTTRIFKRHSTKKGVHSTNHFIYRNCLNFDVGTVIKKKKNSISLFVLSGTFTIYRPRHHYNFIIMRG